MTGRPEKLPELLIHYPFKNYRDNYELAMYFLIKIGQCPIKNEKNVLKQKDVMQLRNECQTDDHPGMDNAMISLLWQFRLTLKKNSKWATSLANVIKGGLFLPTMPHDEIFEATQGGRLAGVTKWFRCRNGHAYGIGDCGQPTLLAKCPCGQPIGGDKYVLFSMTIIFDNDNPIYSTYFRAYL